MTEMPKKDLPASVLARLLNRARETGEDYQTLVTIYASERFLYRLGNSPVRDRFVLKGAMLFRLWSGQPYRATRDLDLLHRGDRSREAIQKDIESILTTEVEPDGLVFDASSIRLEDIRPENEYAGVRLTMLVRCGSLRTAFQVDVGVGDTVWPAPTRDRMPCLLHMPEPEVLAYSPDSVVAEKLEAIVVLGDRNSRIKDFFDIRPRLRRARRHRSRPGGSERDSLRAPNVPAAGTGRRPEKPPYRRDLDATRALALTRWGPEDSFLSGPGLRA